MYQYGVGIKVAALVSKFNTILALLLPIIKLDEPD